MKKIAQIVCSVAVMATMASCGSKQYYTINGKVDASVPEGTVVYMYNVADPEGTLDSAMVNAEGQFVFSGEAGEPWVAIIGSRAAGMQDQVIVEQGVISVGYDNNGVSGTPMNDQLATFAKANDMSDLEGELRTYMEAYYAAPNAELRAEAERKYDSVEAIANKRMLDASWELYNANRDNLVGALAMEQISQLGDFTYTQFDSILADAAPVVKNYAPIEKTMQQMKAVDATSAGKRYTDIQGVDGKLSDLIEGKVALVDFYASWCGPCRAEIKDNLVPLWKKYENKGLVIVGLNVWERGDAAARKAAHEKVMADLGITYPQLVDSTRVATDTYGVRGIPQILLIDKDGTILARDLRGAAIEEAIVNALKN